MGLESRTAVEDVFTPSNPVQKAELFVGRADLLRDLKRALKVTGRCPVVVGPRGVGKTSLIVQAIGDLPNVRVDCSEEMDFDLLARAVLEELRIDASVAEDVLTESSGGEAGVNFGATLGAKITHQRATKRIGLAQGPLLPSSFFRLLDSSARGIVIVLDEVDRLSDQKNAKRGFADLGKTISNRAADIKFIFAGVAKNVRGLFGEHEKFVSEPVRNSSPSAFFDRYRAVSEEGGTSNWHQVREQRSIRACKRLDGIPLLRTSGRARKHICCSRSGR